MKRRVYDNPQSGEWISPRRVGYRLACCDCSLTHRMDFRMLKLPQGRTIQVRFFRDNRATAAFRRQRK